MRWIFWMMISVMSLQAQTDLRYEDYVYLPHIKSVKFHHEGLFTSTPIVDLSSGGQLLLSFDDILGGDITYTYQVLHCDKDWRPSDIDEYDYIDGFNEEEIERWSYSNGVKMDYTHYELYLPNSNLNWLLSGNYLLIVRDEETDEIALTRRFMVVDPQVQIFSEVKRPIAATKIKTHHQIELGVNYKNFNIVNPQREIYVTILKNGQWHDAMTDIQPKFTTGYDMQFDLANRILFPAGREYRFADLRSVRYPGARIHSIDRRPDGYDAILNLDKSRQYANYFDYDDLNGNYIVETQDLNNNDLQSEYIDVHFTLEDKNPPQDADIYVVGAFNDWQLREENRLDYNIKLQSYIGSILLKQGYYDYQYVVEQDGDINYEYYEGNTYKTRNQYTILVYYRAFSERYDQLIAVQTIDSRF